MNFRCFNTPHPAQCVVIVTAATEANADTKVLLLGDVGSLHVSLNYHFMGTLGSAQGSGNACGMKKHFVLQSHEGTMDGSV